jgi:hypothetical protein
MRVWPQNGWFMGLRRILFTRSAFAVLASLIVVTVIINFVIRPDPARLEQEQYSVYSTYLFGGYSFYLLKNPLPLQCSRDPRYTGGDEDIEIQQYFVSDHTISAFSQPSAFWGVVQRKVAMPGVPTAVINNFVNRNLTPERLKKAFSGPKADRLELVHALPDMSAAEHPTLGLKFSKVGFNRDFSSAMFYVEGSCGAINGREYVYLYKALSHRGGWYWYVVEIERK